VLELEMASVIDDKDSWDEDSPSTSTEVEAQASFDPRSYQIEMFQHSMQQNIVAAMATGSGKTMVARLRLEAELQRTPDKVSDTLSLPSGH
jgi:superfamily II DNA or RNA helicase